MDPYQIPGRTLAYLGDAVWSLMIREMILKEGETRGRILQKKTISYVNANAQCRFYEALHEEGYWTEEEESFFHRGRNAKEVNSPHHTSPQVYRIATGFEAILGALQMEQKWDRLGQIRDKIRTLSED